MCWNHPSGFTVLGIENCILYSVYILGTPYTSSLGTPMYLFKNHHGIIPLLDQWPITRLNGPRPMCSPAIFSCPNVGIIQYVDGTSPKYMRIYKEVKLMVVLGLHIISLFFCHNFNVVNYHLHIDS